MLLEWALFFYTKLFKTQLLEEVMSAGIEDGFNGTVHGLRAGACASLRQERDSNKLYYVGISA
jgi:hypothetical protein